jgi:lactate racemase
LIGPPLPGIAGREIIDFTHWLGALVTSSAILGLADTAVRRVIERAASMVPVPHSVIALVTHQERVAGVWCGRTYDAWVRAARLSSVSHVIWIQESARRRACHNAGNVRQLWTGLKGMYKTEPVVADGGEVVVFGPH